MLQRGISVKFAVFQSVHIELCKSLFLDIKEVICGALPLNNSHPKRLIQVNIELLRSSI